MLQTEEKRLKVKIAEMAIQEIRFRIQALNEDIRRADELHELHLALATAQAVSWVGSANTILRKRIHSGHCHPQSMVPLIFLRYVRELHSFDFSRDIR